MPAFKPGDLVLILFPFTDMAGARRRPALILLDSGDDDVLVARVTAQPRQTAFDCELAAWAEAGLKAPSVARLHKLAALKKQLVDRTLGRLSAADWELICRTFERIPQAMRAREPGVRA